MTRPVWVIWESPAVRAMPKSVIFAVPSSATRMLPGLTSRCVVPRSWAATRPSATWAPIAAAATGSTRPSAAITSERLREGTYSMTSQMPCSVSTVS